MWNLWVIFVISVVFGCPSSPSSILVGTVPLVRTQAVMESAQSESSEVRAQLLDLAGRDPETGALGTETLWNKARFNAALNAPDAGGDRFAVFHGRLEQVTFSEGPSSEPRECFVRVPDFGPVIVLASPSDLESCAIADRVFVEGWFHGVEVARARDGRERRYPVFVARLSPQVAQALPIESSFLVGTLCLILAVVWWLVRGRMRRSRQARSHSRRESRSSSPKNFVDPPSELPCELPSDPARALDELARRGDDSIRKGST